MAKKRRTAVPPFVFPNTTKTTKPAKSASSEVLLRNSFILTKKMHLEYSRHTYRIFHKKWRNKVLLLATVVIAIGLLLILWPHWYIPGILALVAGIYFFFMGLFGYVYGSYKEYRNFQEFFGPLVEMEVEFHPKHFSVKTAKGDRDFLYMQIMRRIELQNMSILIVGADGIIVHGQIVDKKSFEPMELSTYYDILENAGVSVS